MQAKLSCFDHVGKKLPVDLTNDMPKRPRSIFSQLCHKHPGSSSEMELVMEASTGRYVQA